MKNILLFLLLALILPVTVIFAQDKTAPDSATQPQLGATVRFAPNTVIPTKLDKSLKAQKVKVGGQIDVKTTMDMLANGQVIMPRDTKIVGHITAVKTRSKDSPDSMVGIAFDRVLMKDGHTVPFNALIQAVGPPIGYFNGPPSGGMQPREAAWEVLREVPWKAEAPWGEAEVLWMELHHLAVACLPVQRLIRRARQAMELPPAV